jgi:hypothetical protein
VSVAERWARTQDQVDRMHEARIQGGLCAWCGRNLHPDETVYVERFLVGTKQLLRPGAARHRTSTHAPVGVECASQELLDQMNGRTPEPCTSCGRGVFYRRRQPTRQQASCSRRCASHGAVARQRARAGAG